MSDEQHTGQVFIVDDDDAVRDSISMLLDTVSIPSTTYASATEFLERFDASSVGCLVLDIRMPGMSGIELQNKLLQMGVKIPIVFVTGHGDVPMAVEAMRNGAG